MKLFLNFSEYAKTGGGTWEDFSDGLLNDGFSRKSCFGPKGKAEMQTVSMRLKPVVGLEPLAVRILTATNNIRAKLTLDDNTPYFVGTIRPLISSEVREVIKPISVEILDDTHYLEAYIFSADATLSSNLKVISDTPSDSLIHWLVSHATVKDSLGVYVPAFAEADIVIDSGIDKTIDADGLTVEIGDYVNAILDTVCYEYNLQYRCSEDGKLHFAPSVPATTPNGARTITNADIKNYVTPKRGDDARKGAVITYYPVVKGPCTIGRHDVMDSRYADDKTWGRGYEWLNPDEGQWPPSAYQNVTLATNDLEKSKRKILRYDYGTLRTKIKFRDGSKDTNQGIGHISDNGDGSARMYIQVKKRKTLVERMYAICNCWYIDEEDEQTTQVHQGQNPEKYEARYLHSGVTANALLRAIVLRSTTGNLTHSFQALPSLGLYPGEIIKLDPAALGFSGYVRIISVIDSGGDKTRQLVDAIAESVTPLNDIEVDTDEQVTSILRRAGVNMLSIQTEATLLKYDDISHIDLTANGDLLSVYGGSVFWYLNDVYKGTGETISFYHSDMLVGVNVIRAEGTIPGINFQDKPLEAEIAVTLVSDGAAGTRSVVQFILGTADGPYTDAGNILGTDAALVGTSLALVGVDGAQWEYSAPTPDAGEFVWRREGYYTPPETWPKVWNITRMTGASSFGLALYPSALTIPVSSRGVPYGGNITISAVFQNIPTSYEITWGITGASFVDAGTNQTKVVDVTTAFNDSVIITVSVLFGDVTYTDMVTLTKVWDGKPAPVYAGVHDSMFYDIGGEPLLAGDCFLYMPKVGEAYDDTNPLFGHVLKWDGDSWESTTDSQSIGFAAKDAFQIARESGKVIFAAVIYTEAMVAANIQAGSGTGAAGSGFRFRAMDDDYSQEGNPKVPVFDIYKDDKQLFKVDVATGKIYFGEHFWYDPATGSIRTPNDKTVIKADGTIEAVDGNFTGNVFANSGYFKGTFDTTALKLEPSATTPFYSSVSNNYEQAKIIVDYLISQGFEQNRYYRASLPNGLYTVISYGDIYTTIQGSSLYYIVFTKSGTGLGAKYNIQLIDSNATGLCPISSFYSNNDSSWVGYKLNASYTLTTYKGGDKLIVSSDMPQTSDPSSLSDYQLYIDPETKTLKVKI